jgi:hypothetical protein
LFKWLGRLLSEPSAVEARRDNPVLAAAALKSAEIYDYLPLNQFIDHDLSDRLARQIYIEIDTVCNAYEPLAAIREKLAVTMLRFAMYQVLMIPPEPEPDASGLRSCVGVSGELTAHIDALARKNIALRSNLHDSEHFSDSADLWTLIQTQYWTTCWFLETLNAVRLELGDVAKKKDWYRPFMHAACANQENLYRVDLELPPAFAEDIARDAPAAYSIFTDIVVSGAKDPLGEWRDYHPDTLIPEPGNGSNAGSKR